MSSTITYHEKKQVEMSDRDVATITVGFIRKERGWNYSTRIVNGVFFEDYDPRDMRNTPSKKATEKEMALLEFIDDLKRRYNLDF